MDCLCGPVRVLAPVPLNQKVDRACDSAEQALKYVPVIMMNADQILDTLSAAMNPNIESYVVNPPRKQNLAYKLASAPQSLPLATR